MAIQTPGESSEILAQHGDQLLLVKITGRISAGKFTYGTTRYQIWRDSAKYQLGVEWEEVGGKQYIYCTNYAGQNDKTMLDTFHMMVTNILLHGGDSL
ncbi:hypothetical protein [Paenibacillus sp. y28]|uniref:hypothetical protein n=1 Tax=Paenibacillus sp. y28 TaxID=3129110 RepID=UPI00301696F4